VIGKQEEGSVLEVVLLEIGLQEVQEVAVKVVGATVSIVAILNVVHDCNVIF